MNQIARQPEKAGQLREQVSKMGGEFKAALPSHIPAERFQRVVMTAINRNPDLQNADRKSLFEASMLAAQDGLLPDGREAALVAFRKKVQTADGIQHVRVVQYMPMVFGIRKKVYQSGEIQKLVARIAYENDEFDPIFGDEERLHHKPNLFNRGNMIAAYAVATFRDGTKEFDVMTIEDIEKVRKVSRNSDKGPWQDWYEEMAKKTVIRRLSKSLPLSSELTDLMRRDDDFYDLNQPHQPVTMIRTPPSRPQTIESRLDNFANDGELPEEQVSASSASPPAPQMEAEQPEAGTASGMSASSDTQTAGSADDADTAQLPARITDAMERGRAARSSGYSRELPKNLKGAARKEEADAFLRGFDEEDLEIQAAENGSV